MARSVGWRRECSDTVRRRIQEALQVKLYIVHQVGPTGFILKEDGRTKKQNVYLGDPHHCTCFGFVKDKPCVHILWLLLKKYRVPQDNPIIFQLALIEREIDELVHGYHIKQNKKAVDEATSSDNASSTSLLATKKPLGPDDVCPICQEDLLASTMALTHCRYGCGNSIHLKCMKVWADHQRSTGEMTIHCPLCREDFGSLEDVRKEYSSGLTHHMHITCNHCKAHPIRGKRYKCTSCTSHNLCESCFISNITSQCSHHHFKMRELPSSKWISVTRELSGALSDDVTEELHHRELTDNDYELLLQLDRPPIGRGITSATERLISSFPVEALDYGHALLTTQCHICQRSYQRGDWVRKLSCSHKFHRRCIDDWLRNGHSVCPVDGISVHTRQLVRKRHKSKTKQLLNTQASKESFPRDFSLIGHSALNLTSLSISNHPTAGVGGRLQRGMVTQQHGRHPKLPVILPQLMIGSTDRHYVQLTNHHRRPARKLSAHKSLPSVVSPDPSINITGLPVANDRRIRYDNDNVI